MPFAITRVETVHKGWSTFSLASVRLPDGRMMKREIEDHGPAAAVLPYDPVRRTGIVVRQFRAALLHAGADETAIFESPSGLLDEDDPETCARREAMEEAGLRLGDLELVAAVWTMPGVSTERAHLFLAPYAETDRVGAGGGLAEEHEDITVLEVPLAELAEAADAGRLTDIKLLLLLQTLRVRRPGLFAA